MESFWRFSEMVGVWVKYELYALKNKQICFNKSDFMIYFLFGRSGVHLEHLSPSINTQLTRCPDLTYSKLWPKSTSLYNVYYLHINWLAYCLYDFLVCVQITMAWCLPVIVCSPLNINRFFINLIVNSHYPTNIALFIGCILTTISLPIV